MEPEKKREEMKAAILLPKSNKVVIGGMNGVLVGGQFIPDMKERIARETKITNDKLEEKLRLKRICNLIDMEKKCKEEAKEKKWKEDNPFTMKDVWICTHNGWIKGFYQKNDPPKGSMQHFIDPFLLDPDGRNTAADAERNAKKFEILIGKTIAEPVQLSFLEKWWKNEHPNRI